MAFSVSLFIGEDSCYIASLKIYGNIGGISYAVVTSRKCKTNQAVSDIC